MAEGVFSVFGDALFGLSPGDASEGIFGKKPIVPKFKSTDAAKEQKKAIKANIAGFGKASELSSKVNVFNQSELLTMLEKAIPEYQAMMAAGSARSMDLLDNESFASMLRGEIPSDVQDAVTNSAAARAVGGGYSGSQMHANLVARDFGLTSLDMIARGAELTAGSISSAERWMQSSKELAVPAQHNVSSMFISPAEQIANTRANNAGQWERDWLAAQVEAAPVPKVRGEYDTRMGLTGMLAGVWSGGGGYQNYYRGGATGAQSGQPGQPPPGGGGGGGEWQTGAANTSYLPQNDSTTNIDYGQSTGGGFVNDWY